MTIQQIREQRVILDSDLAKLFSVETRQLNQALKRNKDRFPSGLFFRLQEDEFSQIKNVNHGGRRYLPYAFTEAGAIKMGNLLRPDRKPRFNYNLSGLMVNEKVIEEYIKQFPSLFLREGLSVNSQQKGVGGLRPDLIFNENGGLLVTEVQLGNLDRYHLYKSLEYRDLCKIKHGLDVKVIVYCNGLSEVYLQILRIHNIEIVSHESTDVYNRMVLADGLGLYNKTKIELIPASDDDLVSIVALAFNSK